MRFGQRRAQAGILHADFNGNGPTIRHAVAHQARKVEELVEHGVPGVHFYVLNKSRATVLICRALTLR
jgi:5,10-methylenetetrahydrofolate reductase